MSKIPDPTPSRRDSFLAPIVFFDGVCGLCNHFVDWILALGKPTQHILFSPLQGKTAKQTLDRDTIRDLSSVVFSLNGKLYCKSTAVLMILKETRGFQFFPIRMISSCLMLMPARISDGIYDWIANRRYAYFGKSSSCRIPTPSERSRFLP